MWRWLFNIVCVASLVLCLVSLGLWARSLGHFERFDLRYARWPQPDELHTYFVSFCWDSNTLRHDVNHLPFGTAFISQLPSESRKSFVEGNPAGFWWEFSSDYVTPEMAGHRPGFAADHSSVSARGIVGEYWLLAVRPWLPTLLFAVLPAIWTYRYRKARRSTAVWQFRLRELFVITTLVAMLLFSFLWLKN